MDEEQETDVGESGRFLPTDAVRLLLHDLTKEDHDRLAVCARHFGARAGIAWEDILQETFKRTLDTRFCPIDLAFLTFLFQTMRSIASGPISARRKARESVSREVAFGGKRLVEPASDALNPEDEALSRVYHRRRLEAVTAAISGDRQLVLLVEGLDAGFRGKDLEQWVGVDTLGLAATRKRLTRTVHACCPEGSGL